MNWRENTLFPELDGHPYANGFTESPEQHEDERARRRWDAAWERAHPPDRTCPGCGRRGGTYWLTVGAVGPRPWHRECAT